MNSQGSAVIENAKGFNQTVEAGICTGVYNVQTGTCNPPCTNCEGVTAVDVTPNPADCPVGQKMQLTATAYYYNGSYQNITNTSQWSSSDTSLATVNSSGLMTGVSSGSPTITATLQNAPVGGRVCNCIGCPPNRNYPGITSAVTYTAIQHSYSVNPLSKPCWVSQFFDNISYHGTPHHAEDVVYDNGKGTGGVRPPYGTPVYAMEAGKVVAAPGNNSPASQGYPACIGTGSPGNYVKIQAVASNICAGSSGDGYSTIYFHVKPLATISVGQCVTAGQQIGTLDNSGCQSGAHTHIARKNSSGIPVNFTLPCTNPIPKTNFFDGLVDDSVPDNL
jgi:murein DD-endopeptidase MepM/ murein hydrolase activator NlpD